MSVSDPGNLYTTVCQIFCRVLFIGHTAKSSFTVCCSEQHTATPWHTRQHGLHRVLLTRHTANTMFTCARHQAYGKQPIHRVSASKHTTTYTLGQTVVTGFWFAVCHKVHTRQKCNLRRVLLHQHTTNAVCHLLQRRLPCAIRHSPCAARLNSGSVSC